MERTTRKVALFFIVGLAFLGSALAQTVTYHLHQEASSTGGLLRIRTDGPDAASVAIQTAKLKNQEYLIQAFDTQAGDPNSSGTVPAGSTVTFRLWIKKTLKFGTMFPRAKLYLNNQAGTLFCVATGSAEATKTLTRHVLNCTTSAEIQMNTKDRLYLWVGIHPTAGPGRKKVKGKLDIEGTLDGNYDSQIEIPLPTVALPPPPPDDEEPPPPATGSRGYLTTPSELLAIANKASRGVEPYKSAVEEVLDWAGRSWNFGTRAEETCSGADAPAWNDNNSATPILYSKALAYHLTGQDPYASQVKTILERIMTEVKSISTSDNQCQLNFGWGTPELVASADLIEDYWKTLTCAGPTETVYGENEIGFGNCKVLFQNWLVKNPYYVVSNATTRMASNNWGAAATNATMYIADYLWDRPEVRLAHRNPPKVNGGRDFLFAPAEAYAFIKEQTLERMKMHRVNWTTSGCDKLTGTNQDPRWPPVKSGITERGIISEDARRQESCNILVYNGSYQNYPQIHLGNQLQQCELMLRRGDTSCYDNVDNDDIPNYTYFASDGSMKTTHLYPGRGSVERAINAIIIDSGTEWRRGGALWVAYRYYRENKRLAATDLSQWVPHLGSGAKCYQDICFGTLTHGFASEEEPGPPPVVPEP